MLQALEQFVGGYLSNNHMPQMMPMGGAMGGNGPPLPAPLTLPLTLPLPLPLPLTLTSEGNVLPQLRRSEQE